MMMSVQYELKCARASSLTLIQTQQILVSPYHWTSRPALLPTDPHNSPGSQTLHPCVSTIYGTVNLYNTASLDTNTRLTYVSC